ncbi:hypothetical protein ACOMHN_005120 [Nucella lapillus]
MKTTGRELFLPLAAFAVWTLTSFLCHKLAKLAIVFFHHNALLLPPMLAPVLLTLWQVTTCYATIGFTARRGKLFFVMAVSHTMATLATNTSLALIFASSTLAIKLLEPVTSAMMQSVVLKAPMRTESVVSMVVIIAGAVMFVGDPFQDVVFFKGVWMALVSNVILGVRNVSIKLDQSSLGGEASLKPVSNIAFFGTVVVTFLTALYVMETFVFSIPVGSAQFFGLCLASSVCHVVYSVVSTNVILRYMSVVGHAIANIVKRVLVVLLLHVSGRRFATVWNWVGLVVCTTGLVLYNGRKISSSSSSSSLVGSSTADSSGSVLVQTVGEQSGKNGESPVDSAQKTNLLYRLLLLALSLQLVFFFPFDSLGNDRDFATDLRHGVVLWKDGHQLLKENITFQPLQKDSQKTESFLQQNLLHIPKDTDQLSPYLPTTKEVIDEASRVHVNLLSNLIGGKKYAILIGAASFENKGDPAITIGELKILEQLNLKLVYYINEENCTDYYFRKAVVLASAYPADNLVILMQGGGNIIGYEAVNRCRMKAFLTFPDQQTILLSQSVFMRGSATWVNKMVQVYCCKPRLTIFLRDRLSFYIASRFFTNGTRLILAPDMAFGIGSVSRFSPPFYDVLWLKRIDNERLRYCSLPPFPSGVSVHVADWWYSNWDTPKGTNTLETAHNALQSGLMFLQRGRVVITERLHGHILSTLLDIPHVILDNKDKKLSSYHNTWTRGLSNVRLAHTAEEAVEMSVSLMKEFGSVLPPIFPGMDIEEH